MKMNFDKLKKRLIRGYNRTVNKKPALVMPTLSGMLYANTKLTKKMARYKKKL